MSKYKFEVVGVNKNNTINYQISWLNPYRDRWEVRGRAENVKNSLLKDLAIKHDISNEVVKHCKDLDLRSVVTVHKGSYEVVTKRGVLSSLVRLIKGED